MEKGFWKQYMLFVNSNSHKDSMPECEPVFASQNNVYPHNYTCLYTSWALIHSGWLTSRSASLLQNTQYPRDLLHVLENYGTVKMNCMMLSLSL